jgi:uncharacterized protein (DUF362 family)
MMSTAIPRYPRRQFLAAAGLLHSLPARSATPAGMPGPYPGRVIAVDHSGSVVSGAYQAEAISRTMAKGMAELTGASGWPDAWRVFFQPGDVVGIKVNPVGGKKICSDPTVLLRIVDGLKQAGVKPADIFVYDRYRLQLQAAGIHRWLPREIRPAWATEQYDAVQLNMNGFDPDHYMEFPVIQPGQDPRDPNFRRSYLARFLTQRVNKVVNLACLKHHNAAGVTLALKNIAFGMANNCCRAHQGSTVNVLGAFIPAILDVPVFRRKVVLHILDGIRGGYENGPGITPRHVWEHKTMYFATDPVALDKVGWRVIDAKRVQEGLQPVGLAKPQSGSIQQSLNMAPEHIEIAGMLGLGLFDDSKIELKRFHLP